MRRAVLVALLVASACARAPTPERKPVTPEPKPEASVAAASAAYYPVRGDGPTLPDSGVVLTRIAVVCCPEPGGDLPALAAVADARPQLLVFFDRNPNAEPAVRAGGYEQLNLNAQFAALNMAAPIVAAPDVPLAKADGERAFETYWGGAALSGDREGVHGSRLFGLPGRRVQVIVVGEGPSASRRAWLQQELRREAEVRLILGGSESDLSATGALVRISSQESAGALRPPPLSGANAGFALVDIDWARERVNWTPQALQGSAAQGAVIPF